MDSKMSILFLQFIGWNRLVMVAATMSLVIVFIPGCATNGKKNMGKAIDFANDYCHIPPMAGEIRELKGGLDLHIDWVKKLEAKAAISVSDSNKIQQELKDYSAQTELLHQSLEQACRHYAICYYKNESRTACSKEYEDQQQKESKARSNYLEVLDKLNNLDQKLGASKPAEKPPATAEPPKLEKFSGTIKSVDAKAKSIVVADGNVEKTFVVDEKAKITKDTSGLTIADLKAEMPAVVEYKKEGDKMIASAIKLSAPKAPQKGE